MHDYIDPIMPGGIVGNGTMLCGIRESGALHRLFWPGIDWGQHMGILKSGIQYNGGPVHWLEDISSQRRQHYIEDTNILTSITDFGNNTEIHQTDLVLPENDVLVRTYRIINNGPSPLNINFITYCSFSIEESAIQDGMYYSPALQALIQYRRSVFLGVKCPGKTPYGFHCGRRNSPSDPYESACRGEFWGCPDNIKSGAGAMGWSMGSAGPGEQASITLIIAAAQNENSLTELLSLPALENESYLEKVSQYWKEWLSRRQIENNADNTLYNRSLLAMKIMSDRSSGGSVAAPEFDSHYIASGGYGYCWPRDGVFVALALDEAGHNKEAGMFYKFAARVQKNDGSWHQRYFLNGDRAPSWGDQIDQTGAVLWGYHHHYTLTGDNNFLNHIWPSVYSGACYLVKNQLDNGLQIPTYDLWEDEFAQSTYSSAAVYGGLKGAAGLAAAMGDNSSGKLWNETAESLRNSILSLQWADDMGTFVKSVNRRVSEGEYHRAQECGQGVCHLSCGARSGYHALSMDRRLDVALLGLCYPFGVLKAADQRMKSTAESIEKNLFNNQVGGIHRYQGDNYAGGNPWVLASLWMSIYHSLQGQKEKAADYIRWARANVSQAGLLPEQVHRHNGGPAWVLPLNWSHAMYVLATLALTGRLSSIND